MLVKQTILWLVLGSVLSLSVTAVAWAGGQIYDYDRDADSEIVATGVLLFGLGYLAQRSFAPLTFAEIEALDPQELPVWDRGAVDNWSPGKARASDYLLTTSLAAPVVLMLGSSGRDQAGVIGVMYLESYLLNSGLTFLMKNAFARPRPFAYSDNPDISQELKMSATARRSFPSGHTSTTFASLVFLATVHSRLNPGSSSNGWVWGGCLAAAATTGYLRYASGWHFPTDILAGATIGAFAGWVVPQIHEWDSAVADPVTKSQPSGQTRIGFSLAF